ncbi:hypothetical protein TanjilG_19260 [Lupinus angustifolius]|uniref:Uncharacterized protein n=1 Tax=Lupinus angustifolius TaxID=3871 RepID=A0A1J7I3N0_LUPAN|nr:PREDICTED: spermidine coumaroyl-CoA acyltransferase-like [Lupinus angustifolius]OIW07419.1 hypothetical protein TanjilG_19260 [Lupinus angustifolius]
MAYHKETLKFEMKEVVFVKPSSSIPSSILSLSDFDHRTDCNGIGQIIFVYQSSNIDSSNNKLDPFFVIKEALSKALLYYYPLAGRLVENGDGKLSVHLEPNHGVPLIEAIANCYLSSLQYLDGNDVEIANKLAFDLPLQDKNGQQYPLVMKVTKFLCGGFTIGLGISHVVSDGFGVAQFFKAMNELACGKSEPSIKPVWERERVLMGSINKQPFQDPMGIDTGAISPYLPTSNLVHGCIKVNGEDIRRLKMSLMKEFVYNDKTMKQNITALDCVMAYVWRSRAKALNQSYDGKTRLSIMTGVRKYLVDPPFPKGYYGNAVVDVYVVLTVKELNGKPLSEIAMLINMSKKGASNSDYIKKSINTIYPSLDDFNHESGAVVSLTDWRHLGYMEMGDLAGNKLVNMVPAPCNLFGMVDLFILTPPSKLDSSMKEGVRVFTSLPSDAMQKFIEEMNNLNKTIDSFTTQSIWWPNAKL